MLLEFGLSNFLSFKEGATVSFRLDANVPTHVSQGLDAATLMCVKGANGSGKTHLLKALAFVSNFAAKSFSAAPDADIAVSPFFQSPEPISFFVALDVSGIEYRYELEVTTREVVRETLFKTERRKTRLFERNGLTVTATARYKALESMKLRPNASILSTAYYHQLSDLEPVREAFDNFRCNVGPDGTRDLEHFAALRRVAQMLGQQHEIREFVEDFLRRCDVGISRLEIGSEEGEDGKKRYYPIFHHVVNGVEQPVMMGTESMGTKQLMRMLPLMVMVKAEGGVLIYDEIDTYLHPHILPRIIELFDGTSADSLPAQLLFTTHNSEVMDLAGRYRTFFVNKEDNESYGYRLDEIPGDILRNDRSIIPAYNDRKIGGVPRL